MTLQVRTQSHSIAGRSIELVLPADPEQGLHEALAAEAAGTVGCDPYWGLLWPAASQTAERILNHEWPARLRALELGCGVGLTGIAALLAGHEVTFSDHAPSAVQMAQANAGRNGFSVVSGLVFEWQEPPELRFDFLFASDVLYESASHAPLLLTLQAMLSPGGTVWIGDPGRAIAVPFIEQARSQGWQVDLRDELGLPPVDDQQLRFRLIVMTRREEAGRVLSVPDATSRSSAGLQ